MKKYYFLAGFPRSGNTLLSSLLNQNPNIYSSSLSPMNGILWNYKLALESDENAKRNTDINNYIRVAQNIFESYYQNIDKPIIIDREKGWATPGNLENLKKYVNPNPKIIFTVRPIIEILTSFINILPEYSYIDREMAESNYWYKNHLTQNDNRCDYLMRSWGQIDKTILSLNEIAKSENKDMFCFIKYDELIIEPQKTMNKIYDFLELPNYEHSFNKIIKLEKDEGIDELLGFPSNLHEIRPQLKKISQDPKKVLSKYIIDKYSNIGWEGL